MGIEPFLLRILWSSYKAGLGAIQTTPSPPAPSCAQILRLESPGLLNRNSHVGGVSYGMVRERNPWEIVLVRITQASTLLFFSIIIIQERRA